ncbi:hypothetical protein BDY21DRAFT_347178 [Lineolata rhizophorae]|uniref:Uncharacterized protein n=1 Tax=Lineolata rhizophorae TaxID=578093 RepID=A0A6A6NXL1_9PEZI|nr:hypothetical protein BDY21DRAFT_347178 [Lineolata rhizophorae]
MTPRHRPSHTLPHPQPGFSSLHHLLHDTLEHGSRRSSPPRMCIYLRMYPQC